MSFAPEKLTMKDDYFKGEGVEHGSATIFGPCKFIAYKHVTVLIYYKDSGRLKGKAEEEDGEGSVPEDTKLLVWPLPGGGMHKVEK